MLVLLAVVLTPKDVDQRIRMPMAHALFLQECDLFHVLLASGRTEDRDPLIDRFAVFRLDRRKVRFRALQRFTHGVESSHRTPAQSRQTARLSRDF